MSVNIHNAIEKAFSVLEMLTRVHCIFRSFAAMFENIDRFH